ncbi:hypothetical protein [Salinibacterium sp. ZJ454]|uniref:hypothetical protein n=1 Tax=Salinibacterium sp. ZJ454 TaxID=2708339 RepID=UPI00141DE520|nr:hypothetical protein [Salinibacterium sp. ZJ454]
MSTASGPSPIAYSTYVVNGETGHGQVTSFIVEGRRIEKALELYGAEVTVLFTHLHETHRTVIITNPGGQLKITCTDEDGDYSVTLWKAGPRSAAAFSGAWLSNDQGGLPCMSVVRVVEDEIE